MKTPTAVEAFRLFLARNWSEVTALCSGDEEFLNDWKQANWEILVESLLFPDRTGFLEVYGDGADCNGSSSRVWSPSTVPTHHVVCLSKGGRLPTDCLSGEEFDPAELTFDRFVAWNGSQYDERPGFDYVILERDNETRLTPVVSLEMDVREIGASR